MLYLIDVEFKAIRKGSHIEADASAKEFILDTENADQPGATLREVATANGLKVPSKAKVANIVSSLSDHLSKLEIPEQSKMGQTEEVTKIVLAGVKAGKPDDEIKVEIVLSGVSFKDASKFFDRIMEDQGLRMSNAERKKKANAMMADAEFNPTEWQNVIDMRTSLEKEIADTNEKQAMGLIRAYLKVESIEMPKKVREKKVGFRQGVLDWMVTNPTADKEALAAHMETVKEGIEEKVVNRYWDIFEHAQKVAAATVGAEDTAEAA